jgi:hypothetical protein
MSPFNDYFSTTLLLLACKAGGFPLPAALAPLNQSIFNWGEMLALWNSRLQAGPLRGFNRAGIFHWGDLNEPNE